MKLPDPFEHSKLGNNQTTLQQILKLSLSEMIYSMFSLLNKPGLGLTKADIKVKFINPSDESDIFEINSDSFELEAVIFFHIYIILSKKLYIFLLLTIRNWC